jgi:mono/diheme cytochrome c family protein
MTLKSLLLLAYYVSAVAPTLHGATGIAWAQGVEVGKHEYLNSCAPCHGPTGKGDGPVGKSLEKRPADLTSLSKANKGVFPSSRIYNLIDGRFEVATHGTRDMPVWGDVYKRSWSQDRSDTPSYLSSRELGESMVRVRILALIDYISTLQQDRR